MVVVSKARRRRAALVVGVLAVLATACVADITGEYGDGAVPWAINDDGIMAGGAPDGSRNARFEPGGVRVALADAPWVLSRVIDINNTREVLGESFIQDSGHRELERGWPVLWRPDGRLVDLRSLIPHAGEQGVHAIPVDINENGLVVGVVTGTDQSLSPPQEVFATFLIDARSDPPAAVTVPAEMATARLWPNAVNNDGDIVGHDRDLYAHWQRQSGTWVRRDLGDFEVQGINNRGDLVGRHWRFDFGGASVWRKGASEPTGVNTEGLPARWHAESGFIGDDGTVVFAGLDLAPGGARQPARWKAGTGAKPELFPLDGWGWTEIWDVNNTGVAVGQSRRASDGATRGIRWF
jgi:hypothetical protein